MTVISALHLFALFPVESRPNTAGPTPRDPDQCEHSPVGANRRRGDGGVRQPLILGLRTLLNTSFLPELALCAGVSAPTGPE